VKKLVLLIALVLVVSACGGTSTGDIQATSAASSGTATETSVAADDSAALDFELLLSDGSTFRLSDEEKPVYLVFWAEW